MSCSSSSSSSSASFKNTQDAKVTNSDDNNYTYWSEIVLVVRPNCGSADLSQEKNAGIFLAELGKLLNCQVIIHNDPNPVLGYRVDLKPQREIISSKKGKLLKIQIDQLLSTFKLENKYWISTLKMLDERYKFVVVNYHDPLVLANQAEELNKIFRNNSQTQDQQLTSSQEIISSNSSTSSSSSSSFCAVSNDTITSRLATTTTIATESKAVATTSAQSDAKAEATDRDAIKKALGFLSIPDGKHLNIIANTVLQILTRYLLQYADQSSIITLLQQALRRAAGSETNSEGFTKMLEFLLQIGINIDAQDENPKSQKTALHIATENAIKYPKATHSINNAIALIKHDAWWGIPDASGNNVNIMMQNQNIQSLIYKKIFLVTNKYLMTHSDGMPQSFYAYPAQLAYYLLNRIALEDPGFAEGINYLFACGTKIFLNDKSIDDGTIALYDPINNRIVFFARHFDYPLLYMGRIVRHEVIHALAHLHYRIRVIANGLDDSTYQPTDRYPYVPNTTSNQAAYEKMIAVGYERCYQMYELLCRSYSAEAKFTAAEQQDLDRYFKLLTTCQLPIMMNTLMMSKGRSLDVLSFPHKQSLFNFNQYLLNLPISTRSPILLSHGEKIYYIGVVPKLALIPAETKEELLPGNLYLKKFQSTSLRYKFCSPSGKTMAGILDIDVIRSLEGYSQDVIDKLVQVLALANENSLLELLQPYSQLIAEAISNHWLMPVGYIEIDASKLRGIPLPAATTELVTVCTLSRENMREDLLQELRAKCGYVDISQPKLQYFHWLQVSKQNNLQAVKPIKIKYRQTTVSLCEFVQEVKLDNEQKPSESFVFMTDYCGNRYNILEPALAVITNLFAVYSKYFNDKAVSGVDTSNTEFYAYLQEYPLTEFFWPELFAHFRASAAETYKILQKNSQEVTVPIASQETQQDTIRSSSAAIPFFPPNPSANTSSSSTKSTITPVDRSVKRS